jgi:uncharacterized protein YdhG (YjbR/CyaY superfamily)
MRSNAKTVREYLDALPDDRRKALARIRALIKKAAPGVTEDMTYGMPSYVLGEPLFGLASQKGYMAFYVCDTDVVAAHRAGLGRVNCGKSCIRFRRLDDLPLAVIERIIDDTVSRARGREAAGGSAPHAAREPAAKSRRSRS